MVSSPSGNSGVTVKADDDQVVIICGGTGSSGGGGGDTPKAVAGIPGPSVWDGVRVNSDSDGGSMNPQEAEMETFRKQNRQISDEVGQFLATHPNYTDAELAAATKAAHEHAGRAEVVTSAVLGIITSVEDSNDLFNYSLSDTSLGTTKTVEQRKEIRTARNATAVAKAISAYDTAIAASYTIEHAGYIGRGVFQAVKNGYELYNISEANINSIASQAYTDGKAIIDGGRLVGESDYAFQRRVGEAAIAIVSTIATINIHLPGVALSVTAGNGRAGAAGVTGAVAGGALTLAGGAAARLTTGSAAGGSVILQGGAGIGGGAFGPVMASNTAGTLVDLSALLSSTSAGVLPPKHLTGLTMTRTTTTVTVASGAAKDSTNVSDMTLASAMTKSTAGTWVAGTGNNGLDTGTIANATWYHVYVILKNSDSSVDVIFSTSASAPTLPSGYTKFRRVFSFLTNGSAQILDCIQFGDAFYWVTPPALDYNDTTLGSTESKTATVPTGFPVEAIINFQLSASGSDNALYVSSPFVDSTAASNSAAPLAQLYAMPSAQASAQIRVLTGITANYNVDCLNTGTALRASTIGWVDLRAKF